VVGPDLIATNRHVVEGGSTAVVKLVGERPLLPVAGVVALDERHDLAILSVPGLQAPAVELQSSPLPEIGQRIYAVGNPRGLESTFSDGIISGIRFAGADSLLQLTAPISPGSSGGPVVNSSGRVVGVAVASIESGQSLNFAVPAEFVDRLLKQQAALRSLASITHASRSNNSPGHSTPASLEGVLLAAFQWSDYLGGNPGGRCVGDCLFSISIRNKLQRPLKNIRYLIVFLDQVGEPLDTYEAETGEGLVIKPGLASRESGFVNPSVRKLTARMVFRILDYDFVN
jgi:hypothetical protein